MYECGLLLLVCRPKRISSLLSNFGSYLKRVNQHVGRTLYISLEEHNLLHQQSQSGLSSAELIKLIPSIYVEAHRHVPNLDVRVLHHAHYHNVVSNQTDGPRKLRTLPEVYLTNSQSQSSLIMQRINHHFGLHSKPLVVVEDDSMEQEKHDDNKETKLSDKSYKNVCLGGTFDCMHNGHKVLLSLAQLKCHNLLTVGVTDMNMVKNKTMWELISPPEQRIANLGDYLAEVDPYIHYQVVNISDPFGPAIVDETIEAIVVSEETIRGAHKINEIRKEKNMKPLEVDVIQMLEDEHRENNVEENKVSSSSLRLRKLGTLLKEPKPRPNLPTKPYIIGLTGLVASGKSSISHKLHQLGATVINVDQIAHKTYANCHQPAYKDIVAEFGREILDHHNNIDRRKLGALVFEDDHKLARLNAIIWPRVEALLKEEMAKLGDKYEVVVLEIALLIEANWQDRVHQVWLTILDEKEAVRRLQRRNQLPEAEAIKRVHSMLPSHEKVPQANVVFCTMWEESFTWTQIRRAWAMLQEKGFIENKT